MKKIIVGKAIPKTNIKIIPVCAGHCALCGKWINAETENETRDKLANHIANKCNVAKFLRYAESKGYKTIQEVTAALLEGELQ
jgi:hypothetical protein